MSQELQKPNFRLTSLDVFRGITISGMILVNMAGITDKMYPPLIHTDWNGWTPTDLVFPFFLFIVGVAMAFSLAKYTDYLTTQGDPPPVPLNKGEATNSLAPQVDPPPVRVNKGEAITNPSPSPSPFPSRAPLTKGGWGDLYWRILRRSLILFALGLFLNGFWNYDWNTIRIMGVLQRISLSYLLSALIVLNLPKKGQWLTAFLLLICYWIAMFLIPVPDYGIGNLSREGNFGAYIDRLIIGKAHLYKGDNFNSLGDPEGLFSTLPAVVSVLFGYFTGEWLRKQPIKSRTSIDLVIAGLVCLVVGQVWDVWFPINKKLWTSSYVVFTTGWALLLLAACYELIEVRVKRRWGKPFEIMGLNAIFVFVASVLLIKIMVKTKIGIGEQATNIYTWINQHWFVPWLGEMNGALLFAILTVLFWLLILYVMYRQRWFVKV